MNLIVSDFDGTFFDNNYKKNIDFINKYKNNNSFVIATGRNYKSLSKELKIKCSYYICNDGGYILDGNNKIIYKNYINDNDINIIFSRINELKYNEYFFDLIDTFSNTPTGKINKISVRIQNKSAALKDMEYMIKGLEQVHAYLSENWINILNIESNKESAIEYILNYNNYDNVYVIGNEINDYNMIKKYNGYLVTNSYNSEYKCIKNFLELEGIIKNDH